MPERYDLTGLKFGRLTVVEFAYSSGGSHWLCECECGGSKIVYASNLTTGKSSSCGCLAKETTKRVNKTHGELANFGYTTEYNAWVNMKTRCYNKNFKDYESYYGGIGVKVCECWINSFENFLADMGRKPGPEYSLDRFPNPFGDYEPSNCRWATPEEQESNKRRKF